MHDERTEGDGPDSALVEWLASHDASCPACRYNLRGLSASRCPECGITFELGLRASMPGFTSWIASLIMAALGVGAAFLFTIGGIYEFLRHGFVTSWSPTVLGACAVSFVFGIVQIVVLVRGRARLWKRTTWQMFIQLGTAALILSIPLATLAAIVLFNI